MTLFVGVLAYTMDMTDSLLNIREDMRNIHAAVQQRDVYLAGSTVVDLLAKKNTLNRLTIEDLEGPRATHSQLSEFMQIFFYDLVIIGNAELLDIFLRMVDRSYPGMGVNWLFYTDSQTPYTLLDKAFRLRARLIATGDSTHNIDAVIKVLIEHGGEFYQNMINRGPLAGSDRDSIDTQAE